MTERKAEVSEEHRKDLRHAIADCLWENDESSIKNRYTFERALRMADHLIHDVLADHDREVAEHIQSFITQGAKHEEVPVPDESLPATSRILRLVHSVAERVRRETLEEAAKLCVEQELFWKRLFIEEGMREFGYSARESAARDCAKAIRALAAKEKP